MARDVSRAPPLNANNAPKAACAGEKLVRKRERFWRIPV